MSRSAVIAAYSTLVRRLAAKLMVEGADAASAHRMAVNACRCYYSPPFDVIQVPEDPDGELARKMLADDPLDEEEEIERRSWDLYVDSYVVPAADDHWPDEGTGSVSDARVTSRRG